MSKHLKKSHNIRRVHDRANRNWIAMGTLAAIAVTTSGAALSAQTAGSGAAAAAGRASLPVERYDIAAGTLGEAVTAFQRASGWTVSVPDPNLLHLATKAVSGVLPAQQALTQILAGTGVRMRITGSNQATLALEEVRSTVEVQERTEVSSPRYTEPLRDLAQTITVIPRSIIEQQGASSLTDVLRNVPGLTIAAGEGGTPAGDNLTLRGNSARNDIFVDGVRDLNPQSRDPFNLEQVEVTKGPTSAITGRGSAGGAINLISKSPVLGRVLGGSLNLGNADTRRGTIDANVPLEGMGLKRAALRMSAMVNGAGVPGRNVVENNRWGVAPTMTFGLGTPTRLTVGYYKLKQDNISDYGIPWVPATNNALAAYRDKPAPVPRETFYGFANRDREVLNQDTGTVRFEHELGERTQLRSQFRVGESGRNSVASPPRFAGNDSTAINRELRSWVANDRIVDSQTDLRATVNTGKVRHSIVTGAAFTHEGNTRINRTGVVSPTTLLNPNPNDVYTGGVTTSPFVGDIKGNTQSVWFFDTASFGKHIQANGGVRWEHFNVNGVNTTPAPVAQDTKFASIRSALIYKPVEAGTIYGSYGTSVSPSLEGLSYSTANTAIPPEKTYTTEVGTKWEVARSRLLVSGALFQVKKDNARTPGLLPTDPPQILAGRQVSQGLELSASGAITRRLRVLGSYTLIDARIRSSNNPVEVGRKFQNTPRNAASIWLTYTARKFTVGVGPRFMGRRYGNNTNTRMVDAYGTLDLMASYAVNPHLDLRFNLSNVTDTMYYERLGGGHVVPGAARFAQVATTFRF